MKKNRLSFPLLASTLVAMLCSVTTAHSEVQSEFLPGGQPVDRTFTSPELDPLMQTGSSLLLPFYRVDVTDSSGVSTLFAVRNGSDRQVLLRTSYFAAEDGLDSPFRVDTETLDPKAVRSTNLRDVAGLPADGQGMATGYALIEMIDPESGQALLDATAIGGERFVVDPGNAFASGSGLVGLGANDLDLDLCRAWDLRFFAGGSFNGGTMIAFYAISNPGGTEPFVTGNVYDESGAFLGVVELTTSDHAFEVSSLDLGLPASFGAVEWVFPAGVVGHVSATFDALGLYSVGAKGICADVREAIDLALTEGLSGEALVTALLAAQAGQAAALFPGTWSLVYDRATGWWNGEVELDSSQTAQIALQFQDELGQVQEIFDTETTATILVVGEATGNDGQMSFDFALTGLDSPGFVIDGRGSATYQGISGAVIVDNVAQPTQPVGFPESGTITVISSGVVVTLTFDGSSIVQGKASYRGITQGFTLNLLTGEIVITS